MNWARLILGRVNNLSFQNIKRSTSLPFQQNTILSQSRKTGFGSLLTILFIGLLVSLACNISQFFPKTDQLPGSSPEESGLTTLGLIINQNYQPVVNAQVGENQLLTDRNGVVTGVLEPNQAGLIPVKAAGYVTSYGTGTALSNHTQVMIVQLNAIDTFLPVTNDHQANLLLGDPETPVLQVSIPNINASEEGAILQLTETNPLSMPEPWVAANRDLALQYSFSISHLDRWGDPLPMETPSQIRIASHNHDTSQLTLAYFDSDQGNWIEIPDGCNQTDPQYLSCTIPHFSHFGLFGPGSSGGALGSGGSGTGEGSPEGGLWEAYFKAKAKLGGIYKNADQSGTMPDEETLREAIEDLQEAAENLAQNSSPEEGKNVLADAAADAMAAGQDAAADAMMEGARDIIRDIAEDLLDDDDCGKISELTHTASQAMGVGGMPDIANQLMDKLKNRQEECNVWKGTIHYSFFLDGTWTANPKWKHYSGGQSWTEVHEVTIAIKPKTGALDGDSLVTMNMPGTEYRYTEETRCGPIHNHQHLDTGGGSGSAALSFEGFYQEGTFTIGPMQIENTSPVNLEHHTYYALTYAPAPPPKCVPTEEEIKRIEIAEYTSQLIHGFFGSPEPPSLQDMLNNGSTGQTMGMEVIRGTQDLSYSIGGNLSPLIPVSGGTVTWNFIRVNKAEN